jgi:hypothetical protein
MPAGHPDYPHHTQIARYFDAYVDHFGLRDRITFNTEVHAGAQRRRLERHPRRRNHAQLPGRSGRKRPPLGREMAGAALPRPGVLRAFLFLSSDVVDATDNRVALYRRVVHTDWPSLYFIGLLQSLGAIMPSAELQSEWIADVLEGKVPGRRGHEARDRAPGPAHANALRGLEGHTIQVDFHPYMRVLRRERKRKRGLPRALAERSHELRLPSPAR